MGNKEEWTEINIAQPESKDKRLWLCIKTWVPREVNNLFLKS